jgi:hypothetical protein
MHNDDDNIPWLLRQILEDAERERPTLEQEAARRFVLGRATAAEYLAAIRASKDGSK